MSLVAFRQGVLQIITEFFFIYFWKVLCYIDDLNAYITGSSLRGLWYCEQGHLCAVADQSGHVHQAQVAELGGIWEEEQSSAEHIGQNLNHRTSIKILNFISSPKTLKDSEKIGSKGSFIFVHS